MELTHCIFLHLNKKLANKCLQFMHFSRVFLVSQLFFWWLSVNCWTVYCLFLFFLWDSFFWLRSKQYKKWLFKKSIWKLIKQQQSNCRIIDWTCLDNLQAKKTLLLSRKLFRLAINLRYKMRKSNNNTNFDENSKSPFLILYNILAQKNNKSFSWKVTCDND